MQANAPLAFVLSDVHFSHKAPIARSQEPDWYEAMSRPWRALILDLCFAENTPVIIAGDIFHHWNVPAELINFAMQTIPSSSHIYAIPGQHDLPHHRYEDMKRSAFWTLVEAGTIKLIEPGGPTIISRPGLPQLALHAFPWGTEVVPLKKGHDLSIDLAVVHSFIWTKPTGYEGAPAEARLGKWYERLAGYDAAVFGDNHIHFLAQQDETETAILNCGCFIRRSITEAQRPAYFGKLTQKGKWEMQLLDGSKDIFITKDDVVGMVEEALDVGGFIEELAVLGATGISFLESLEAFFRSNKVSQAVRTLILEAVEKDK